VQNNGAVTFGIYDGSARTITSPNPTNDGQWHHVVGTFSPGTMKFYLAGAIYPTALDASEVQTHFNAK
jgi:hypothetical protein